MPKETPTPMDKLQGTRDTKRKRYNAVVSEFHRVYTDKTLNVHKITAVFNELKGVFDKIQELDEAILEGYVEAGVDQAITDKEEDTAGTFRLNFFERKAMYDKMVARFRKIDEEPDQKEEDMKRYKLPKIEIKKFGGDLKDWITWWSQFQKIHEDTSIAIVDKFQYLYQCMLPESPAKRIVDCYPQSEDNYQIVIDVLKDRFGRESLLSEMYVREYITLVINRINAKDKCSLAVLYDDVNCRDKAVQSLKIEDKKYLDILKTALLESCLPTDVLKVWERLEKDKGTKPMYTQLMEFLNNEVRSEQKMLLATQGFGPATSTVTDLKSRNRTEKKDRCIEEVPTAAALTAQAEVRHKSVCVFCSGKHDSKDCRKARNMSIEEKKTAIVNGKVCFYCLGRHFAKSCKVKVYCQLCNKRHHLVMCPDASQLGKAKCSEKPTVSKEFFKEDVVDSLQTCAMCSSGVLLQTVTVKLVGQGHKNVRVLMDNGAERSCILERTASELGLKSLGQVSVTHSVFGGKRLPAKIRQRYEVELHSLQSDFKCNLMLFDQTVIVDRAPSKSLGPWVEELKRLNIPYLDRDSDSADIELLIGSDYWGKLLTGKIIQLECGLTAMESVFGWMLSGVITGCNSKANNYASMIVTSMFNDASVSELWNLETIGIKDSAETKSRENLEQEAKQHFLKTVSTDASGRYIVQLPWTVDPEILPNNFAIAERRLKNSSSKLRGQGLWKAYDQIFKEWLEQGIIRIVPNEELHYPSHYLPHRAVVKPSSSTTKIRPVFDASCRAKDSFSLNDCLEKGQNLLELIPAVLLRFREKKIGLTADIRKAFLQIGIYKPHQDYLRFLWWEDDMESKIRIYRHQRVVFGVTCSPFLLGAVIEYHLSCVPPLEKELAKKLWKSFYVDNCVTSVESEEELAEFQEFAIKVFKTAMMDLCVWESSAGDVTGIRPSGCGLVAGSPCSDGTGDYITSVLGLSWDKREDSLSVKLVNLNSSDVVTKRVILSELQKLFDPLGFISPITLKPKLLLQEAWIQKLGWDSPLPDDICKKFNAWRSSLAVVGEIRVPRRISSFDKKESSWTLHVFCDASQSAFAAVVYLRCEKNGIVTVRLVMSKSRVSPVKKITIPRLELLACLVGARLKVFVTEALALQLPTFYWSDSTTAIAWIRRKENWGVFVTNRVNEIRRITDSEDWRHVPGLLNPADLPSRGCDAEDLFSNSWWEGPSWLRLSPEEWPSVKEEDDEDIIASERKKCIINLSVIQFEPWYDWKFSSYSKIVRLVAWMLRWRNRACKESSPHLSVMELDLAEKRVLLLLQQECGITEESFPTLKAIKGEDGIVRIITRLTEGSDCEEFKYPILLPSNHHLVEVLVREVHLRNHHAGVQLVMRILREKFWIVKSRQLLKRIISSCGACRRFTVKPMCQVGAALPVTRIENTSVFQVTGVDLCGPLLLKGGEKVWIVLYTCAVYHAVHLELVSSISTEAFLQTFRRFVARRNRPAVMYSDQGTNFVGVVNILKNMDWKKIKDLHSLDRIDWRLNPPASPWWGGWWERLIRIVKGLLVRILGRRSVDYEELSTVLCEVEGVINSRPLTYVSEDPNDLLVLSPSLFIKGVVSEGIPDLDSITVKGLRKRHQYQLKLIEEFRSRFRNEYLASLVQRAKDKGRTIVNVGDVVLIGSEDKKRLLWPMGVVVEVIPGRDGAIRVVKVKTASGILVRPIQRLHLLETEFEDDDIVLSDVNQDLCQENIVSESNVNDNVVSAVDVNAKADQVSHVVRTRSGRIVKVPLRFGM